MTGNSPAGTHLVLLYRKTRAGSITTCIYTAGHITLLFPRLIPLPISLLGINAQARKLQKSRSRVMSTLIERTTGRSKLWRSKSTMDMLDCDTDNHMEQDKSPKHQSLTPNSPQSYEFPETCQEQNHIEAPSEEDQRGSGARTEGLCQSRARGEREGAESEREETESSDDNTTQYSIHPPHDCPYLLLLQGHSATQVSHAITPSSSVIIQVLTLCERVVTEIIVPSLTYFDPM